MLEAALGYYIGPLITVGLGVVVLHESLPPERLAGFVLVWIALAILGDAARAYRSHQDCPLADLAAEPPP